LGVFSAYPYDALKPDSADQYPAISHWQAYWYAGSCIAVSKLVVVNVSTFTFDVLS